MSENLGLIKAIHSGVSAPSNTQMLWYDTVNNAHFYYDTVDLIWKPLRSSDWLFYNDFTLVTPGQLTVDNTTTNAERFKVGRPIRLKEGSTLYYGIVIIYSTGTVVYAGCHGATAPTTLEYGPMEKVINLYLPHITDFNVASSSILKDQENSAIIWKHSRAHAVQYSFRANTVDTGASQVKINVILNSSAIGPTGGTSIISPAAWAKTIPLSTDPTKVVVDFDDDIEVESDNGGSNRDGSDLDIIVTFVLE